MSFVDHCDCIDCTEMREENMLFRIALEKIASETKCHDISLPNDKDHCPQVARQALIEADIEPEEKK